MYDGREQLERGRALRESPHPVASRTTNAVQLTLVLKGFWPPCHKRWCRVKAVFSINRFFKYVLGGDAFDAAGYGTRMIVKSVL